MCVLLIFYFMAYQTKNFNNFNNNVYNVHALQVRQSKQLSPILSILYINSGNLLIYNFLTSPLPSPTNFVHGFHTYNTHPDQI